MPDIILSFLKALIFVAENFLIISVNVHIAAAVAPLLVQHSHSLSFEQFRRHPPLLSPIFLSTLSLSFF